MTIPVDRIDDLAPGELAELLLASVTDYAIFTLDPAGRVTSWNAGAERIKGYVATEIIGQHFSVLYPDDERASGEPERELLAAAQGRYESEGWRVHKDGRRFWANVIVTPVFGQSGALIGFAKVTRDLSERPTAEGERLRVAAAEGPKRLWDRLQVDPMTLLASRRLADRLLRAVGCDLGRGPPVARPDDEAESDPPLPRGR